MAKNTKARKPTGKVEDKDVAADAAAGGSVDAIRDIIFGAQMKDYDHRFSALERRLIKKSSDLKKQVEKRMEKLEAEMQKGLAALQEDLQRRHENTMETIEEAVTQLTSIKADRSLLSKLLIEMASKIDEAS